MRGYQRRQLQRDVLRVQAVDAHTRGDSQAELDALAKIKRIDDEAGEPTMGELPESVYVQHTVQPEWHGWLIGRFNDNPYLARVVWVEPEVKLDQINADLIRPAERRT